MAETNTLENAVRAVLDENPVLFDLCLKLLAEDIGYDFYAQTRAGVVSKIRSHSKVLDGIGDIAILKRVRVIAGNLINPEDLDPELVKLERTILERFEVKEE